MRSVVVTGIVVALVIACALLVHDNMQATRLIESQRQTIDGQGVALRSLEARALQAEAARDEAHCLLGIHGACPREQGAGVGGPR